MRSTKRSTSAGILDEEPHQRINSQDYRMIDDPLISVVIRVLSVPFPNISLLNLSTMNLTIPHPESAIPDVPYDTRKQGQ
jgi:hypothetical protein